MDALMFDHESLFFKSDSVDLLKLNYDALKPSRSFLNSLFCIDERFPSNSKEDLLRSASAGQRCLMRLQNLYLKLFLQPPGLPEC